MQGNTVAYDEGGPVQLERKLSLEDAISDLPAVKSSNCYCWVWFTFSSTFLNVYLSTSFVCRLRIVKTGMRCHMQGPPRQNFRGLSD